MAARRTGRAVGPDFQNKLRHHVIPPLQNGRKTCGIYRETSGCRHREGTNALEDGCRTSSQWAGDGGLNCHELSAYCGSGRLFPEQVERWRQQPRMPMPAGADDGRGKK